MQYTWYKIFNLTDWLATGLSSRSLTLDLENLGRKDFLITQGNTTALTFEGLFLPLNFADKNPYVRGQTAIYKDANQDVFIGFEVIE